MSSFPKKPMTEREFEAQVREKNEQLVSAMLEIHRLMFTTLYIESVAVGRDQYFSRIIIQAKEVAPEQLNLLVALCKEQRWSLSLRDDHELGSRLAVWVA